MLNRIKQGDIVGRKSYGKDIVFTVNKIINNNNSKIVILKGIYERIEADSDISDLELIEKAELKKYLEKSNHNINKRINDNNREYNLPRRIITGKILHLDGECSFIYTLQSCLNTEFKKI